MKLELITAPHQYQPEIAKNIILLGELRQQDQDNNEVLRAINKLAPIVDRQLATLEWKQ